MLNSTQRVRMIQTHFHRKLWNAHRTYHFVDKAVRERRAVSVIRLGDVMAKLLARREIGSLNYVSDFLGIRLPPSDKLRFDLEQAVRQSDLVGLSHYITSIRHLKMYMRRSGWKPFRITDSFINDQLYEHGYLHRLMKDHRVVLVGRAAATAARQLRRHGIRVVAAVPLDNYNHLGSTLKTLARRRHEFDLALVGASVPGRILCTKIARTLKRSAIEIGHMMDAMSHPNDWKKHKDQRKVYKFRWMRKLRGGSIKVKPRA